MALPQSAQDARARRDLRMAGYRPTIQGAQYEGAYRGASGEYSPFSPVPLKQRTKMDNLGGKIRNRTYEPRQFTPISQSATIAQQPQFGVYNQIPPMQGFLDPVTGGATFLFQ
jgi:hypothetical protein